VIEFSSVSKSFGDRSVLRRATFQIKEGEIAFILGTSGTGKSVLLKTIVGLLKIDEGLIKIDGERVSEFSEEEMHAVRKKCGMVFQHPALFDSVTIFENVAFGLRRHYQFDEKPIEEKVRRALSLVQLSGQEGKLPSQISYGMQKRASLARTIVLNPKILLFDEPTTGMDPVTTSAINRLIFDLSRQLKTTSIVVSHDMRCALDIADRILVLNGGQIVAEGKPSEIIESSHPLVKEFMAEIREAQQ